MASPGAFNQLVGYAKYINRDYGNVYYRGIKNLYDNVLPNIMRGRTRGIADDLKDLIRKIKDDKYIGKSLHLDFEDQNMRWLGDGILVSEENMFPSPSIDSGYNNLLMSNLFTKEFEVKRY